MSAKGEENEKRQRFPGASIALLSTIITILPVAMLAGWILGYFLLDRFLGTFPWGSIILTLAGAGAGFYEILQILLAEKDRDGSSSNRRS